MGAERLDRRAQKTRNALRAAFTDLLLEQGYETMKVGDLAARANVGRSTFYEHYRTKRELLAASLIGPFTELASIVGIPPARRDLLPLLEHFRQNRRLGRVLLAWPTRVLLTRTLAELIQVRLPADARRPVQQIIPSRMIATYLAESQLALIESWLSAGKDNCSAEALAKALQCSSQAIVDALVLGSNAH
jgi:AcrR family transcriptional regulator